MVGQFPPPSSPATMQRHNAIVRKLIHRLIFQATIFILILQFLANIALPDHEADAFRSLIPPPTSPLDQFLRSFLQGLTRWDAQHFLHIAQFGYIFEHSIAFFPLFPVVVYVLASTWYAFVPWSLISFPTALILSATILNAAAFLGATWSLFALTKNLFWSNSSSSNHEAANVALITTILFILNPANIFFRAMYTESIYAFLTFFGLNCLLWKRSAFVPGAPISQGQKPGRNLLESAICFGLALTTRSNGLLNLGYLLYYYGSYWIRPLVTSATGGRSTTSANIGRGGRIRSFTFRRHAKELMWTIPVFALALIALITPFLFGQFYQYETFCKREKATRVQIPYDVAKMAKINGYILPGDTVNLQWCHQGNGSSIRSIFTLPYTAVQGKYWQVGLFGYYQWKKLPLFILATPAFLVTFGASVHFLTEMRLSNGDRLSKLINPHGFLPFILHMVILTVVGGVFINVEVFTRMLFSSTPLVYWYCASLFLEKKKNEEQENDEKTTDKQLIIDLQTMSLWAVIKWLWRRGSKSGKWILVWFLGYTLVGTVAFANFLPWT